MDSKTSDEKLREEFEAWATLFMGYRMDVNTDGSYVSHSVNWAWHAWLAASSARSEEMAALRAVLMRTANALDYATHFVSKEKGVMPMLEVLAAARAALTPTEKTE